MADNLLSEDQRPFFTIVIASLNNIHKLRTCIDSLNEQSFASYEVLVSDGGSDDGTASYLSPDYVRNIGWTKSSVDGGIYHALNAALPEINGKWVLVLGSDDRLSDSSALARAHAFIVKQSIECGLIYSDLYISDSTGIRLKKYPAFDEFSRRYAGAPFIHHQSALVSSSAIRKLSSFDTIYRIHADYDLMLKVLGFGPPLKIDDAFVVYDATGYSSRLRNILRSIREVMDIRRRHGYIPLTIPLVATYSRLLFRSILF